MARSFTATVDRSVPASELPDALGRWVHEIYEVEFRVPGDEPVRFPVSAFTDPALNVTLSGSVRIRIGSEFTLPAVTLAGPQPGMYVAEVAGTVRGFYVRFVPVGPLALLGVDDYSLGPGGARPLHEMVRPELREATAAWETALLAAPHFEERVELTTDFLLRQQAEPDGRVRLLHAAVEAIDDAGGNVRIDELARRLAVSASTLRRHFAALGVPPKRFASVVRFRRAHAYLSTTPGATWADVVARFGYSDQAHLVRDYRRFSGAPPTRWDQGPRGVDRRMGIEEAPEGPPSEGPPPPATP